MSRLVPQMPVYVQGGAGASEEGRVADLLHQVALAERKARD
jgi:hypothetical protein